MAKFSLEHRLSIANEATAISCFHDINFNPTKLVTFFPGQISFSEVTEVEEASHMFYVLFIRTSKKVSKERF